MPHEQITLYTAKACPYAQRTEIALAEVGAPFKRYEIDLGNKPEWYAPKVNPASKVPAIAYGGPDVSPENASPESIKLAESLILVEFIGDLYPSSGIVPADPVLRAQARFFIEVVSTKFSPNFMKFISGNPEGTHAALLAGVDAIQDLLPDGVKYAVNDQYTIADIALAPFWARLNVLVQKGIGAYKDEEKKKFLKGLEDPKYAKFNAYIQRLLARQSFKSTFHEDVVAEVFSSKFGLAK
ncbi:glutathione S-transferase C-terminal-like protein [Suillus fuscotomentosus]|uniref:Glutathione S-transferase C-terminal-like protein n=1 Tax=Suillus fuscotomentosus TaxID=1912939 RepID=A0AAD4HL27_9AGAM|nr:glutathione S-transferase C-terminal-like protein [Suillus fuscotomentosus]KAG1900447.1 glutathione S-transferase C-terminal-like protein [Suillus fuscotomentosus]